MTDRARNLVWVCWLVWVATGVAYAGDTHFDRIHFQVRSTGQVANDRMQALLMVHGEDRDPARLANAINTTMQWALKQAGARKDVQVRSQGYRIEPVYEKQVRQGWRGRQGLLLDSADFKELADLIGVLQSRLQVQSIDFTVSTARRQDVENGLISAALTAFRTRAGVIVKDLHAAGYRIVELNIGTGGRPPGPTPMMAARESAVAPALQAGTTELTVTADGVIELTGR